MTTPQDHPGYGTAPQPAQASRLLESETQEAFLAPHLAQVQATLASRGTEPPYRINLQVILADGSALTMTQEVAEDGARLLPPIVSAGGPSPEQAATSITRSTVSGGGGGWDGRFISAQGGNGGGGGGSACGSNATGGPGGITIIGDGSGTGHGPS